MVIRVIVAGCDSRVAVCWRMVAVLWRIVLWKGAGVALAGRAVAVG